MKISDKIKDWRQKYPERPFFSLEFFPPKTETGLLNLYDRFDRFSYLHPMWVDVTWGAGGSTQSTTLEMCTHLVKYHGLEALMHLTCTNTLKSTIDEVLLACKKNGIRNILALRGDPPVDSDEWKPTDSGLVHAIDLVKHIREKFGDFFCIGVAAYPEGHLENPDKEDDLMRLKEKVDAGADFIITQLFYDTNGYLEFVDRARSIGIEVPILPGIMPIQSYSGFKKMTSFCKTKVPQQILDQLEEVREDDQKVKNFGVELAVEMCKVLTSKGAQGLHFYTLNLEVSVVRIIEALHLIDIHLPNREYPWRVMLRDRGEKEEVRPIFWANRTKSYVYRTSGWDEFPNGRWGKRDSPAYGDAFYSASFDPDERSAEHRRKMWNTHPRTERDVIKVFCDYLKGDEVKRLPWCSDVIGDETNMIKKQLTKLNLCGLCTINSQPRVNGALSTDPYVGWGPKNGFCFQKAYIEFFCSPIIFQKILKTVEKEPSLSYTASNAAGEIVSNCVGTTNAVTWGIFPNEEVKQPTVVDFDSFVAWKDEAFSLWMVEWASIYPTGSESRALLENIQNTWYLMNIVDNNFMSGNLFGTLISAVSPVCEFSSPRPNGMRAHSKSPQSPVKVVPAVEIDVNALC